MTPGGGALDGVARPDHLVERLLVPDLHGLLDRRVLDHQEAPGLRVAAIGGARCRRRRILLDQLIRHRIGLQPPHRAGGADDFEYVLHRYVLLYQPFHRRHAARTGAAAVDDDVRAGHVARQVGAKIQHRARRFPRAARSGRWGCRRHRRMHAFRVVRISLRFQRAHHARLHRAGTHRVDPHAERRDVGRRDLGQAQHTMLRRHSRPACRATPNSPATEAVFTIAPDALLQHHRQHVAQAEEDALQVDRDDLVEHVLVIVLGRDDLALDAGVVEEAVDAAIRGQGLFDVVLHRRRFRHVGLHEVRVAAPLRDDVDGGLAERRRRHRPPSTLAPRSGEAQRGRSADAAATAGDQRNFAGEIPVRHGRFSAFRFAYGGSEVGVAAHAGGHPA